MTVFIEHTEREKGNYYVDMKTTGIDRLIPYIDQDLSQSYVSRNEGGFPKIYNEEFSYVGYLSKPGEVTLGRYLGEHTAYFENEGRGYDTRNEFGIKLPGIKHCWF